MSEKIRKTLYIPQWVADFLDLEGQRYDGPGVVAATAILFFSKLSSKDKIAALKAYRDGEIEKIYGDAEGKKPSPEPRTSRQQLHDVIARIKEMVEIERQQPGTIYRALDSDEQKALDEFRKFFPPERKKRSKTA